MLTCSRADLLPTLHPTRAPRVEWASHKKVVDLFLGGKEAESHWPSGNRPLSCLPVMWFPLKKDPINRQDKEVRSRPDSTAGSQRRAGDGILPLRNWTLMIRV